MTSRAYNNNSSIHYGPGTSFAIGLRCKIARFISTSGLFRGDWGSRIRGNGIIKKTGCGLTPQPVSIKIDSIDLEIASLLTD